MAGIPGGATLAAVILCWLGATAPAGRPLGPGWLRRWLAGLRWPPGDWPWRDDEDLDDDDDQEHAPATQERWDQAFAGAYLHWARAGREVTAEEWAAAMLRARAPHLFDPGWFDTQIADHVRWCDGIWVTIRAMKREAGISE